MLLFFKPLVYSHINHRILFTCTDSHSLLFQFSEAASFKIKWWVIWLTLGVIGPNPSLLCSNESPRSKTVFLLIKSHAFHWIWQCKTFPDNYIYTKVGWCLLLMLSPWPDNGLIVLEVKVHVLTKVTLHFRLGMAIKQGSLAKSIVNEYMYFIAIVNS